jgi:HEPN domain-containing protein
MKAETREWVRCAEEDFTMACLAMRSRTRKPTANPIGFHCQQCVEKYLKGCMEESGLPIPKTHNLVALVALILPQHPLWAAFNPSLLLLNNYAVKFRYPGHTATRADAREALRACRSIRGEIRLSLGLPKR